MKVNELIFLEIKVVADPGFSKWGGAFCQLLFSKKLKLKELDLKWGGALLLG